MEHRYGSYTVLQMEPEPNDDFKMEFGKYVPLGPRSTGLSVRNLNNHRVLAGSR